jgi:hypothetical protein
MSLPTGLAPDGRWGGAVTQRPLPEDGSLAQLSPEAREAMLDVWWSQAATERRVAHSFAMVHAALVRLEADAGVIAVAARAVDDELRHAALCMQMANRYQAASIPLGACAAGALTAPEDLPFSPPHHPEARSARVRDALHVVGQCVFNETLASAYLTASLESAKTPLARAALRELLSDEIDHARVGWAYLATLPSDLRTDMEDWLKPIAISNLREWRAIVTAPRDPAVSTQDLAEHGLPSKAAVEDALLSAMRDLILPGLAHAGLRAGAVSQWAASGAAT